jgi:hypothetical protein
MERCESWLNRHAWRACVPHKGTVGSNPTLSARTLEEATRPWVIRQIGRGTLAFLVTNSRTRAKEYRVLECANEVVLGGEVAVPCHPQSAIAGLNPS